MVNLPLESRIYEPVEYWKSDVPEGTSGDWRVERYECVKLDPESIPPAGQRPPEWLRHRPGIYTRLRLGDVDFMTDFYEEWWSQRVAIREGLERGGHILISGLGLGLVVECLLRPEGSPVEKVTVLEKSGDVLKLVAPHLRKRYGTRLEILNADAMGWQPPTGTRFTVAWHDIWPDPDADYSEEIALLHARYAPCCDWQRSWTRDSYTEGDAERDDAASPVALATGGGTP